MLPLGKRLLRKIHPTVKHTEPTIPEDRFQICENRFGGHQCNRLGTAEINQTIANVGYRQLQNVFGPK